MEVELSLERPIQRPEPKREVVPENPATKSPEDSAVVRLSDEIEKREDKPEQDVERAVEDLERAFSSNEIRFDLNGEGSNLKFQVVEKETGRILRQFPPDELPDLFKRADKGSLLIQDVA